MARIKGVDIPNDKQVGTSLTYIYGIGKNIAKKILNDVKIDEQIRVICENPKHKQVQG